MADSKVEVPSVIEELDLLRFKLADAKRKEAHSRLAALRSEMVVIQTRAGEVEREMMSLQSAFEGHVLDLKHKYSLGPDDDFADSGLIVRK
jgi:site-specific recombinase